MQTITQYGPGDEATWPACTGHPHDPRTDEDDEDQHTTLMLGEIAGDVVWALDYLGEPQVVGVEIGGLFADAWRFARSTVDSWRSAIALELDRQRADYIETEDA